MGTLPSGFGTAFIVIQSNPTIGFESYNSQLAFSFVSDKIAIRRRNNSDWTSWKYLTFS